MTFTAISEIGMESYASEDYEECIGAKKHLVLGVLSHTGPLQGSTTFANG